MMSDWLHTYIRAFVGRYLNNEQGQEIIVWLIVLFVLWLVLAGRRGRVLGARGGSDGDRYRAGPLHPYPHAGGAAGGRAVTRTRDGRTVEAAALGCGFFVCPRRAHPAAEKVAPGGRKV